MRFRPEIEQLERQTGQKFSNPYDVVELFEQRIAGFTGAPFAVACDCNTHAIELCLRRTGISDGLKVPHKTYPSIPMTLMHLGLKFQWSEEAWQGIYHLGHSKIYDASLRLKKNMYIKSTMMCLSFQFRKRLPIGRGGMILLDNEGDYQWFKKAVHDGRTPGALWKSDSIDMLGFHYYMTPDDAARGILLMEECLKDTEDLGGSDSYPDIRNFPVFSN